MRSRGGVDVPFNRSTGQLQGRSQTLAKKSLDITEGETFGKIRRSPRNVRGKVNVHLRVGVYVRERACILSKQTRCVD